jgi:hypothetical protein
MMSDLEENEVKTRAAAPPPVVEEAPPAPEPAESAKPPAATRGWWASLWAFWKEPPKTPPLVGNPLHPIRGTVIALAGGLLAFVWMALEAQFRWGVPLGILGIFVSAAGILDFMGTFDDPDDRVTHSVTLADIKRPLGAAVVTLGLTLLFIGLASAGRLPIAATAVLITASFIGLVVSVFRVGVILGPWALDETGNARPLAKREGFWVVLTGTLLYLPMQGSYSLSDPWGRITARWRAKCWRAMTGSRRGGRRTAGSGRSRCSISGCRRSPWGSSGSTIAPARC